jgi:SAM-dependent methyltransferase
MDPELYERFYEIEDRFWWSVGTRRIFFELVRRLPEERRGAVVDVGCGTGVTLQEFPPGWRLVCGCDYSDRALSFCRARGLRGLVRGNATQLPFTANCMDLVLGLDVIEHLDDDEACVRDMTRICRAGGHVLLHVPAFPVLWSEKDQLNHHRRRYRRGELRDLVERCGLQVRQLFYVNVFLFPVAFLRSLTARASSPRTTTDASRILDQLYRIPPALNRIMIGLMAFERWVARWCPFPFGMSLVCLAQKPL